MDDLFALPEGDWLRIRPALARMRRVQLALALALTVLVLLLLGALVPVLRVGVWPLAVVALLVGGWLWWLIGRNVRNWGYAERAEDLWIRRAP